MEEIGSTHQAFAAMKPVDITLVNIEMAHAIGSAQRHVSEPSGMALLTAKLPVAKQWTSMMANTVADEPGETRENAERRTERNHKQYHRHSEYLTYPVPAPQNPSAPDYDSVPDKHLSWYEIEAVA